MAEAFFVAGLAANACVQAQGVTVSSADSLFPAANLQNGKPWEPFRFGGLGANPSIAFDCNIIANPSFELDANDDPPTDWKTPTGGGTPTVSTTLANEGTKSLRLNAANEAAYQDRTLRPGGTYRISVALAGDGTNIISAYVQDLISGKWLLSNGTWSTAKTAWATRTLATFATSAMNFTLEEPVAGHVGPARVRILFDRPGTATAAYVDSVYVWPKITVAALMFDTIPTAFPVAIESADDAAFSTNFLDNGDLPARRFRRYLPFTGPATSRRFWRFNITGTPVDEFIPWVGQPLLAERNVFLNNHAHGNQIEIRRMPKGGTEDLPASLAEAPRYEVEMLWRTSYTSLQQVAEKLVGGSVYGDEPVLIVPDITRPEMVYGRGGGLSFETAGSCSISTSTPSRSATIRIRW